MISKFYSIKSFSPSKWNVYVKILWIGAVSRLFADEIAGSVMHCLGRNYLHHQTCLLVFLKRFLTKPATKYVDI